MQRREFIKTCGVLAAISLVPTLSHEGDHQGIFEGPRQGFDYSIGVSTATLESETSVISVIRYGKGQPMLQAAELCLSGFNSSNLIDPVIRVAEFYSKYLPNGPLFSIEQIAYPGDLLQAQLKLRGFKRFHVTRRYTPDRSVKEGWYTTAWSRPVLVGRFLSAVKDGDITIKSGKLLELTASACASINSPQAVKDMKGDDRRVFMATATALPILSCKPFSA